MRSKQEILNDTKPYDGLSLEVLLDIRDLLKKAKPPKERRKKRVKAFSVLGSK